MPHPIETLAFDAFEQFVQVHSGFRPRPGQVAMARAVAKTLSSGDLGKGDGLPQRAIAVIQAGTGVGKSVAYSVPAIVCALERQTRVLISTGTVSLQEQLVNKDLPMIADALLAAGIVERPVRVVLAKGRGRYLCPLKLNRLIGVGDSSGSDLDLEADLFAAEATERGAAAPVRGGNGPGVVELGQLRDIAAQLAAGHWAGDNDSLATPPEGRLWGMVAADRHSCTNRRCPHFHECPYFKARKRVAEADVIVVNHDLLLSSVSTRLLPDLSDSLVVFDEGHNLPEVAAGQFAAVMDLTRQKWVGQLASRLEKACRILKLRDAEHVAELCRPIHMTLQSLYAQAVERVDLKANPGTEVSIRFENGVLPEGFREALARLDAHGRTLSELMARVSSEMTLVIKEEDGGVLSPTDRQRIKDLYGAIGVLAPRVTQCVEAATLALEAGPVPKALWLLAREHNGFVEVAFHASPLHPGPLLLQHIWSRARSVVVTSATLQSCGSFDFFLHESGLGALEETQALAVPTPFDYARQGRLVVRATASDPKQRDAFERESNALLVADLKHVRRGALVLFASRAHMNAALAALPSALKDQVLVQGQLSRTRLLEQHRQRVDAGQASIVLGLQSFGEGLDLPGAYCEWLFIAKLPFAPPTDPLGEARAEWLKSTGKDAFGLLVVPQTSMRLCQWAGRAIRTEDDQATIVCYDKRLTGTAYGRRILGGLPPFGLVDSIEQALSHPSLATVPSPHGSEVV